ncbi:MAG TPA: nucleotidyltransferase domain-containing protein, partial [Polyangiaceae bacterium]|nr:nucleotidyltransferase domain-containing protein [Polyangiaceae bacterium]
MFEVGQHTIFLTLAGSQAHGTAREGSDVDVRGVCVAPLAVRLSLFKTFEQYEGELPLALADQVIPRIKEHATAARGLRVKAECVIYDIAKFLGLCAAANPNALEILFASEADWLLAAPAWRRLHDERLQFLTRKVQQTFSGYALAQLKKIQTHRSWLLSPPTKKPSRQDFGLRAHGSTLSADDQNRIEQGIAEKVRSYGIDNVDLPKPARIALQERLDAFTRDMLSATTEDVEERLRAVATAALGIPSDVASTLNAEKRYRAALKHWDSYQTWQAQRNPARAELERSHGYDTKHAMHLIRLMRMGLEILQTGELRVRRDDAEELSAIRDGALSFEQLLAMARNLQESMEAAAAVT